MIGPSSVVIQIGREIGNNSGPLKSSVQWDKVTNLNDSELQVLLTLLRNTYSAVVGQASIRGVKLAAPYTESITTKEEIK